MTNFDVELDMTRATVIDEKIEGLLRGIAPDAADPLSNELASMRQGLSHAFPLPVIPELVEDEHLARMMAAVVPAVTGANSEVMADRTSPLTALKASFARRVAAATLALSTAFGGAAYAGVLPEPVQDAVSKAAAVIGIDLPRSQDADPSLPSADDDPKDESGSTSDGDRPEPNAPSSENRNEDQGDLTDSDEDARESETESEDEARDDAEDERDDIDDSEEPTREDDEDEGDGDFDEEDSDDGDSGDGDSDYEDNDGSDSDEKDEADGDFDEGTEGSDDGDRDEADEHDIGDEAEESAGDTEDAQDAFDDLDDSEED